MRVRITRARKGRAVSTRLTKVDRISGQKNVRGSCDADKGSRIRHGQSPKKGTADPPGRREREAVSTKAHLKQAAQASGIIGPKWSGPTEELERTVWLALRLVEHEETPRRAVVEAALAHREWLVRRTLRQRRRMCLLLGLPFKAATFRESMQCASPMVIRQQELEWRDLADELERGHALAGAVSQ